MRLRFDAFNEGVRGDDVIDAVVQEWISNTQRPAALTLGRPGIVLPNPLYDRDAPKRVVEHLLLGAQGRAPDEEGSFFTGRDEQLGEIVAWMGRQPPSDRCIEAKSRGIQWSVQPPATRRRAVVPVGPEAVAAAEAGSGAYYGEATPVRDGVIIVPSDSPVLRLIGIEGLD